MSNLLTARELKEQGSIVDLLSRLGYEPVPKHGREKVYISMLRDNDTSPSFSVNDEMGVWFDHGTRKGGNIIDFGLAYWKSLSFNEVVQKIQDVCLFPVSTQKITRPRKPIKIPHYIIEEIKDLGTHPAITDYLKSRGIFQVAKLSLNEVYYYVEDHDGARKHFFAAGWQNENGGWEVRNRYFKGCLGPKAVTVIPGHEKKAAVFEGFINYLSWKIENQEAKHSIIVLNTLALMPVGIEKAKAYSSIDLFFDRDHSGHSATREFVKALPYATDRSIIYDGFNDYNDKIKTTMTHQKANPPADIFKNLKVPFSR